MKVVGFSPWQHVPTSIEGSRIVPKIIGRPSTSSSSSKRAKFTISSDKKSFLGGSSLDFQPDLVLSSDHQISVLGHTGSKRILKSSDLNSAQEDSISEVSRWIYTSRPGDQTSFLPKLSETEEIGAVVDPNSRTVFSMQNDNQMIKIWSLDEDVSGPNDSNEDGVLVKQVDLPSPVVSMDAIPFRKQTRVKIKDNDSIVDPAMGILGGVAGLLASGQTFVLIIDISRQVQVEIYGDCVTKSKRRKSTSTTKKNETTKKHLYSVVSYNSISSAPVNESGQKRKLDSIEASETGNCGEIVITHLCLDSKKSDGIEFAKHTISLHGIVDKISATYGNQTGVVELQHELFNHTSNGNGHEKSEVVRVTQLDPNHVAMVYQSKADGWFVTILDTKFGQSVAQYFPLLQKDSATIVDIAGLSTSILAILTSDDNITVYDVRRAIVLHEFSVYNAFPLVEKDEKCKFGMTSNWYSGTLGIVRKHLGSQKRKQNVRNHTIVSFAKIGIFDNEDDADESPRSKPALKGSYNLARAIASSMLTTSSMADGNSIPVLAIRDDLSVTDWLPRSSIKVNKKNIDANKLIQSIEEAGHNTNRKAGAKSTKLSSAVEHAISSYIDKGEDLPQKIVDTTISLALDHLSTLEHSDSGVEDCIEALLLCIKTGKVSGRDHLENKDFNFRSMLSFIKKSYDATATCKRNIMLSPVNFIYYLLRYCEGSLPEHALVTILHFVLCYIAPEEFQQHWIEYSQDDAWYTDTSVKVLQKRLKKAVSQLNESNSSHGVKTLIEKIKKRLYTAQQLFFIEAIVSNSRCNSALLKFSLKEGLTHSDKGEIDLLIYALSQLLRKVGKSRKRLQRIEGKESISSSIAQWLSAVIDSNLSSLLSAKSNKQTSDCIELAKKEVSATIIQTNALLSLQDLMNHFDTVKNSNSSSKKVKEVTSTPPLYGIEMLVF